MRSYFVSVWAYRFFWFSLVKNDLLMRYRRSLLGVGWSFLYPLTTTFVLCAVFQEMFKVNVNEFAPMVLSGVAFWSYITRSILEGAQCYVISEMYIRQHPLPIAVYPLRTTLGAFFHFAIAMIMVVAMTWIFRGFGNLPTLIFLVPALALLFLFTLAVATLVGFVNAVFRDTQYIMELGFQVLFYLTPIIYPARILEGTRVGWILQYNPLVPFLSMIREPILENRLPSLGCVLASVTVTFVVLLGASLSLPFQQRRVISYL